MREKEVAILFRSKSEVLILSSLVNLRMTKFSVTRK